MASTISRFCEFYVRESAPPGCMWVIPNDYVQRRAVSRRGERLLSNGDLSAHEPDQTVDHRCAVNLGLLDRAAGVSGGATLPSLGELKV
jgi:hypothetical protein